MCQLQVLKKELANVSTMTCVTNHSGYLLDFLEVFLAGTSFLVDFFLFV